ncbi:hypothetical protein PMI31_02592 [Pseudomonas sp. GM55]|nr:hypothetical protein PMI31_02592 [Pseudomonas sp. GM55]
MDVNDDVGCQVERGALASIASKLAPTRIHSRSSRAQKMSEHSKSFRIKISHESFGDCLGQTRNLSATGVYVKHPKLSALPRGAVVYGQVQDLPTGAPRVRMEVVLVDAEGIGLRYL